MILGAGELQAAEMAVLLPSLGTHLQVHAGIRRVTRLVSEGEDPPAASHFAFPSQEEGASSEDRPKTVRGFRPPGHQTT